MSVAVCFLAKTGIVLGTDSRVTARFAGHGETREDAYPKLIGFGEYPVGMAMVGAGFYGGWDFRSLITEARLSYEGSGQVGDIAQHFGEVAGRLARGSGLRRTMSVWIAGFSPGEAFGELHSVELPSGRTKVERRPSERTIRWMGADEAINTLWWGGSHPILERAMAEQEVPLEARRAVLSRVRELGAWGPERLNWGMPLHSAVDLVTYLLDLQIGFERFQPGRARCGHPLQVLTITREGARWVHDPFDGGGSGA